MTTFYMICFDVSDEKRLRNIAKTLENYGQRVQKSVFEAHLEPEQLYKLKEQIGKIMDEEVDQVRYYTLCPKDIERILIDGPGTVTVDPDYYFV